MFYLSSQSWDTTNISETVDLSLSYDMKLCHTFCTIARCGSATVAAARLLMRVNESKYRCLLAASACARVSACQRVCEN